jgi:hypothetical protein
VVAAGIIVSSIKVSAVISALAVFSTPFGKELQEVMSNKQRTGSRLRSCIGAYHFKLQRSVIL